MGTDVSPGNLARPAALGLGTLTEVSDSDMEGLAELFARAHEQICTVIKGKAKEVRLALVCMLSQGHLLLEDVPGVGKTTLAKSLAATMGLSWRRIQFTPDLLPSDVTGVSIFDRSTNDFSFRPGGVFANVLLADEINRASPKTQAALLEAMEELQVTVDAVTYPLPRPFMVVATQNPVEQDGTYPLPVSELDRFLMRVHMGYPDHHSEVEMLQSHAAPGPEPQLAPLGGADRLRQLISGVQAVHVSTPLQGYMVELARATRQHPDVAVGLSPRAVIALQRAARTSAACQGRRYVSPDDVKALLLPVGSHRLVLTPDAVFSGVTGADVLGHVLGSVPVPVPGASVHAGPA